MKAIEELEWIKGLKAGFALFNAKQKEQYSWLARTDASYVFTAELDHKDKAHNRYEHAEGYFHKFVRGFSVEHGDHRNSIRHAQELYDAVNDAFKNRIQCHLLVVMGTKFGDTLGGIKAAAASDFWVVTHFAGSVNDGFSFRLNRVSQSLKALADN